MDMTVVGGYSVEFVKTPTVSTSPAYTAGDQVGGIMDLSVRDNRNVVTQGACQEKNAVATLLSVAVHDKASQSAELVIFFFNALPTVASSDNSALTITDAEMAAKCLGSVTVPASAYATVASSSMAVLKLPDCALAMLSNEDNGPLYAVMKTTGTPTYASTSDLTLRFLFGQDGTTL